MFWICRFVPWCGALSLVSILRFDKAFGIEHLLKLLVGAADFRLDLAPFIKLLELPVLISLNPEAILIFASFGAVQLNDELGCEWHVGIVAVCCVHKQPRE